MNYFWNWGKTLPDSQEILINDEVLFDFIPLHTPEDTLYNFTRTPNNSFSNDNDTMVIDIDSDVEFMFEIRKGLQELITWNDFQISPDNLYDISLRNRRLEHTNPYIESQPTLYEPENPDYKQDTLTKIIYVIVGSSIGAIISIPVVISSVPVMVSITTLGGLCGYLFSL